MLVFLFNAAIVLVFLFVFALLGVLMLWVIIKMLRSLFPEKFSPSSKRLKDET